MAFLLGTQTVINDSREIENIVKASVGFATFTELAVTGVTTFLGNIDAEAGIITASAFYGDGSNLTGVLSQDGGGNATLSGDLTVENISVTGTSLNAALATITATTGDFSGELSADTLVADTSLQIAGGVVVTAVLDEDDMVSDSETAIPTQQSVKKYVDDELQTLADAQNAAGNLKISVDGGTIENVSLADGNLDFVSSPGETEISLTPGATASDPDQLTIGLPADVTIADSLTVTNGAVDAQSASITGAVQAGSLTFDGTDSLNAVVKSVAGAGPGLTAAGTDEEIPTAKAVFDYVTTSVGAANQLRFVGDDGAFTGEIELASESIDFQGTPDQIITAVDSANGNEISFALAATTKIQEGFVVGEGLGAGGADVLNVNSTSDEVNIDGELRVTGNVRSASDIRLKENIEVITDATEKVQALRGVLYTWKSDGKESGGIIAQEVQEVLPELVIDQGTHLSVQYNGLIGLLIESNKELAARIEALEAKN